MQPAMLTIPHGESEHPVEVRDRIPHPPCLKTSHHYLGVGMADKAQVRFRLQELLTNFLKVINFTIEDDHEAARVGAHRLMARWGQIEDGKTPVAEGYALVGIFPIAFTVRTTMANAVGHRHSNPVKFRLRSASFSVDESRDSTHGVVSRILFDSTGDAEFFRTGDIGSRGNEEDRTRKVHQSDWRASTLFRLVCELMMFQFNAMASA
jgi:hypothetical protein